MHAYYAEKLPEPMHQLGDALLALRDVHADKNEPAAEDLDADIHALTEAGKDLYTSLGDLPHEISAQVGVHPGEDLPEINVEHQNRLIADVRARAREISAVSAHADLSSDQPIGQTHDRAMNIVFICDRLHKIVNALA